MLTAIAIADTCLSTAVAVVAVVKWKRADRLMWSWHYKAVDASRRASDLDEECERLSGHITRLSAQLDEKRKKPGPSRRAKERALIASKTAELVRGIAA